MNTLNTASANILPQISNALPQGSNLPNFSYPTSNYVPFTTSNTAIFGSNSLPYFGSNSYPTMSRGNTGSLVTVGNCIVNQ